MSTALVIPDLRTSNLPVGWAEDYVMRGVIDAPWDDLDEYEAQLRAMASYIDSLEKGDAVELEKALRMIEARRGELLDHTVMPGTRTDLNTRVKVEDVSAMTATRYRKIARHWQTIWPELAKSNERRDVSQAAVLRMIERIEAAAKPKKSAAPSRPTPKPAPEAELEEQGWGHMDPLAELEKVVEENAKQAELIEHLSKPEQGREILSLHSRIAGLEARISQLTTTAGEAQKQARGYGRTLEQVRKRLKVERNSEILPAIEDLMR
jgi:hypothetical protein